MKKKIWPLNIVQTIVCIICVGTTAVPFILSGNHIHQFLGSNKIFIPVWRNYLQEHRVSNSYGLFRRMTGVGHASKYKTSRTNGWAGQPPSIVERPEIIMEGLFSDNKGATEWRELNFRWKPGAVHELPKQVAPHQPRLDWQMWFAALGSYQHNPWLINFIDKMLHNCSDVIELVNEPCLQKGNEELLQIQSKLYHYDFTRIQTKWNIQNPSVQVEKWPKDYWTRKFINLYLPSLEKENPSVSSFLSAYGYPKSCQRMIDRCTNAQRWKKYCELSVFIRETQLFWCPIILLIAFWSWETVKTFISSTKKDGLKLKSKKE